MLVGRLGVSQRRSHLGKENLSAPMPPDRGGGHAARRLRPGCRQLPLTKPLVVVVVVVVVPSIGTSGFGPARLRCPSSSDCGSLLLSAAHRAALSASSLVTSRCLHLSSLSAFVLPRSGSDKAKAVDICAALQPSGDLRSATFGRHLKPRLDCDIHTHALPKKVLQTSYCTHFF